MVGVSVAVEDDDGEILHFLTLGLGHIVEVLGDRRVEADCPLRFGADRNLFHVHARTGVVHGAPGRDGDDGQRVAAAEGGQGRAVDRVDGDVGFGVGAIADALAVVEHRRLVLFAFTDDDHAVHRHGSEHVAHGIDRGAVGPFLVTPTHPAGGGHRRRFGDSDQLECEVAVRHDGSVRHVPDGSRIGW